MAGVQGNYGYAIMTPEQNGRHLADGIFKFIFLNENFCVSNKISLKYVPYVPIGNKSVLDHVVACRLTGNKPLPELMLTKISRLQCVNSHVIYRDFPHAYRWISKMMMQ